MSRAKQVYLNYWKQLKFFVDELGLDWTFSSFEAESQIVVKIGAPKHKICLSLQGPDGKGVRSISAGFWIPDSRETFARLQARSKELAAEIGQPLWWDSRPGRKSCWIWVTVSMDLSQEKNWPASFEWFAKNATRLRDVVQQHLESMQIALLKNPG
ncbi:MAG: DUF4268 domain-containing protein [Candidatus Omnitrophica bacterium]|nr:DUF4268 domain-containing protein [Candidatus Omnitrophota bacterium]